MEICVFGALYAAEGTAPEVLEAVAREFSPRIERHDPRETTLDLDGLRRLFGTARAIAEELRRTAADRGVRVRVAIARTRTTARLLVRHRAGITIVEPEDERAVVGALPLALLGAVAAPNSQSPTPNSHSLVDTLTAWGLRTLGDFAVLPADEVAARLGQEGVRWQRLACGDDPQPLVPSAPEERFEQALDLDWPIEGLEPLSFVLGRLMDPLAAHLERRGRGAAVLHIRLHLVTRHGVARQIHERSLQLPAPMRDARALRTLALLDLESHPPAAAIERVAVAVDPTAERVVQFSLLTRPLPSPEQLSTLMARLGALVGEGRCGSPVVVDTWRPGAFAMTPFAPRDSDVRHRHEPPRRGHEPQRPASADGYGGQAPAWAPKPPACPTAALRRFRFPLPVRVRVEECRPVRVTVDRRGLTSGQVVSAAGPWRTSGGWWAGESPPHHWSRDEWDVTLHDGATYRVFHERHTDGWFLEGIVD
jgi:protein ImuB